MLSLLFSWYVALSSVFNGCRCENNIVKERFVNITRAGKYKFPVVEPSGIEACNREDTCEIWTINDSGGQPCLWKVTQSGKITGKVTLDGCINRDWEDLAKDDSGRIYIGDFGNNLNLRKVMLIYRIEGIDRENSPIKTDSITFQFSDQKNFPPEKKYRNFDCEAFYYFNDTLFLFSKNRGNHWVKLYKIPAHPGNYFVHAYDSIFIKSMITSADISEDKKWVALLGYGKIYFIELIQLNAIFKNPIYCQPFRHGQTESILFLKSGDLLVSNEAGKIWRLVRKKQGY